MDKSIRKLAIDDIYRIGTPDAAVKLVPFLWDEDEDFAIYVAWHLGVLLKQPEVEEKLSQYPLKPEQTPVDELTYIWRPFEKNSDSALFTITSRLAYLIKESSKINIPRPVLSVDPRIIIPICAVETCNKFKNNNRRKKINFLIQNIKVSCLDAYPDLKRNLFHRLLNYPTPTRNDWIKLYAKDVDYNSKKLWYDHVVLLISILGMSIMIYFMLVSTIFIIVWIVAVLGFYTVLWKWLQKIDYYLRGNPLKGILDSIKND